MTEPVAGLKPYTPLQLTGRDIYVREGCYNCHSQMVRPFRAEVERYGQYSVAGEFVYDRPFQWGSKRTGPDLHRVGGRYSDDWHRIHLLNPRDVVPESNMPAYPWLAKTPADADGHRGQAARAARAGRAVHRRGHRQGRKAELAGKTEMDALIAYLRGSAPRSSRRRSRRQPWTSISMRSLVTVAALATFLAHRVVGLRARAQAALRARRAAAVRRAESRKGERR